QLAGSQAWLDLGRQPQAQLRDGQRRIGVPARAEDGCSSHIEVFQGPEPATWIGDPVFRGLSHAGAAELVACGAWRRAKDLPSFERRCPSKHIGIDLEPAEIAADEIAAEFE